MPNTSSTRQGTNQPDITQLEKSIHFETVKKIIPAPLRNTSLARIKELKKARPTLPDWHSTASKNAHRKLKNAVEIYWAAQNDADRALHDLQDVYSFAKPLLQKALKDRFDIEDDVEETWLRLYAPVTLPWWVHDFSAGTTSRTVSLLDAALHNFTVDESFTQDSEFITRPDARGHFVVKKLKQKLSIEQFQSLCRELNIGAAYLLHLNGLLLPSDKAASNILRNKVTFSHKSALNVAAHMARIKKDIDQSAYDFIQGMLDDRAQLKWHGRTVNYYNLEIMDTRVTGVILISGVLTNATGPEPVIAYVPNDPEHPLKQYPSMLAFMNELTRQFRDGSSANSYQQFFAQFVPHQQRGHFFAGLNKRLFEIKWEPVPSGSNLPTWRETPVEKPNLQFRASVVQEDRETSFKNDLWGYYYRQKLNKILNDAREIAISTEYVDRMARWAWWDNLEKILSDILNVALLVATPFVPGLGTLVMAYTAYQLTSEVVEGVVDLAEGHLAEAGEQIIEVLESVVQLGTFAAAGAVGGIASAKLSPFFEGLKPVQLANGETRLWNQDLAPYQRSDVELAADARPDAQGLHTHQGRRILPLDNQHFDVVEDPVTGQQRIRHPRRADAYAPTLRHNGQGAWVCETENPRDWEGTPLMRRLGHITEGYSDEQLEEIRQISSTTESALRRVHVESVAPPPLLIETLLHLKSPPIEPTELPEQVAPLFSDFPELPATIAENIIAGASGSERQRIDQENRLPLRLSTQARELQFETQAVRAAQGLYPSASITADTERLVLGTLRFNTDTFGNLRLEVREGAFDGELRCSFGPDDAEKIRVLIRDDAGKYQVRDGEDQPIHPADDFFEAVLQATQENGQTALGYKPGQGEMFRQWIMVKSEPPRVRRTVLATPPVRAVAEHKTMLLVHEGGLSKAGMTLHERIQDLHPHFSEAEVDTFANALIERGEPQRAIEQQENDLAELRVILEQWERQQPDGALSDNLGFISGGGRHIVERLIACYERKNTELGNQTDPRCYSLDLSRELLPLDLEIWWSKLPRIKRHLDKITILKVENTRFSSDPSGILKDFPNLLELYAENCNLSRLPESISSMHYLEHLRLDSNTITLDPISVETLRNLTHLRFLTLDNNSLSLLPDIGLMPRLLVIRLRNTGITTWPDGIFAHRRPRLFLLDLRGNPINQIPEVISRSPDALVVGRTHVDMENLSTSNRLTLNQIRLRLGLRNEIAPVPAPPELSSSARPIWTNAADVSPERIQQWEKLKKESNSGPFLAVVNSIESFADYRSGGEARTQLLNRLWRMLDAVYIDTPLREKLFAMAKDPVSCGDAGAQLFNNMGIEVLNFEAYSRSTEPSQLQDKLVTLAKGSARLEMVNDIARADMSNREGSPDEVEVYLAYQSGLTNRLSLPWQSEGMLYRPVSGVTDAMIENAYDTIVTLENGDGLINKMLELDFWDSFLRKNSPSKFEKNKQLYQSKFEKLEILRTTQHQWANSLSDSQRIILRNKLKELMSDLPVLDSVVFNDDPMSEDVYNRLLVDLGYEEKELSRRLTRAAMKHANI